MPTEEEVKEFKMKKEINKWVGVAVEDDENFRVRYDRNTILHKAIQYGIQIGKDIQEQKGGKE